MNTIKKITLLLALFAFVISAKAQQKDVMTFDLGDFAITLLSEGQSDGNPSILIGATDEMLRQTMSNGTYPSAVNVFLVQTGNKNVLFDAGFGTKLFDNLKTKGLSPADINVIMMTHLHGDHIGGLLVNGRKAFPNAEIYIAKAEHDYWMSDTEMNKVPENGRVRFTAARAVINAYRDKIRFFIPNEIETAQEIFPGIRAVAAYGHTPGHTCFMVESQGDRMFIWGDLVHAMAIQMPFPEVAVIFDVDTRKAIETRRKLLEYLEKNNIQIAGAHIEFPGIGNLRRNRAGGYHFTLICECLGR
jgi:glyoxylase-like metal-dependent hydrolase (beta-lactamase superfamily II)